MTTPARPALPAGRYGPPPRSGRRPTVVVALVAVTVVVLAWILWVVIESRSPVQWTDVGFRILSNQRVDVTYDVHKDKDATVTCTLRALDQGKSTVGTTDTQTQMAWRVPDIHAAIADLRARGVQIEEYRAPDPVTTDGIADMGHSWAAWFLDPSMNVLAVVQPKA